MTAANGSRSKLYFRFGWPISLGAPAAARRAVEVLPLGTDREGVDELRLLISEVVTNAVVHSGGTDQDSIDMLVEVRAGSVRVEVRDGGRGFVSRATSRSRPLGGLGTVVLDRLSSAWGTLSNTEFGVWFEFPGGYLKERRRSSEDGAASSMDSRPQRLAG